ncbi:hypothetical protein [Streptomyces phytophilus]|nr:hypothetical protein [Streptomyces phytophilus]
MAQPLGWGATDRPVPTVGRLLRNSRGDIADDQTAIASPSVTIAESLLNR